mmetsp:Transcript_14442/g.29516  ORF Transcript_14442/g.29516 Transcript_14442/m.29516 type:complete len:213 (+) Transcript_14442:2824-3462(+)
MESEEVSDLVDQHKLRGPVVVAGAKSLKREERYLQTLRNPLQAAKSLNLRVLICRPFLYETVCPRGLHFVNTKLLQKLVSAFFFTFAIGDAQFHDEAEGSWMDLEQVGGLVDGRVVLLLARERGNVPDIRDELGFFTIHATPAFCQDAGITVLETHARHHPLRRLSRLHECRVILRSDVLYDENADVGDGMLALHGGSLCASSSLNFGNLDK